MESIMSRDPELEASFSFNLLALHIFSDDNDEEEEEDDDDDDSFNDDKYIEISLEQKQQPIINFNNNDDGVDEFELRISFSLSRTSSTVKSHGNEWETAAPTTTPSSSSSLSSSSLSETSTLSCSSAEPCCWAVDDHNKLSVTDNKSTTTVNYRRAQFRAVNRLFKGLFSSPMTSSEHVLPKAGGKMTKATNGGGMMMKFFIKCRSINIRAALASLMKPYQMIISTPASNQMKKKTNYMNCPSSAYGDDDSISIQAAIAHCKRSYGQNLSE